MASEKLVLTIVFLLLLLIPSVSSLALEQEPAACQEMSFYKPGGWVGCFSEKFSVWAFLGAKNIILTVEKLLSQAMILDIDLKALAPVWLRINILASVILVLIAIYNGYLWLFSSFDPSKKLQAREQTINLIYLIIFTNLSLLLVGYLINASHGLARYAWRAFLGGKIEVVGLTEISDSLFALFAIVLVLLVFGISFIIKVLVRYILLLALVALLPIIVVLYFFLPTRRYGQKMIELLIINAFFPFIWILVFAMGRLLTELIEHAYPALGLGLLHTIIFASALYLNTWLYKSLGANFELSAVVVQPYQTIKTVYHKVVEVKGQLRGSLKKMGSRYQLKLHRFIKK